MKGRTKNIKFKFYSKYLFVISFLVLAVFLAGCGGVLPPTNQSPTASFTANPTSGIAPLEVAFDASNSSDSDGSIISYAWDFKDGNTGSGETINHTFSSTGSYNVKLTVTDDKGATDSTTKTITVTEPPNQSPIASFTASPTSGVVPLEVFFDASGSYDPDGNIVSYEWDFKDGNTGNGETINHTFSSTGNYNVRLTVTDDKGATDSTTKLITVDEIVYRALCVGVGDYIYGDDDRDLLGPPYDVDRMIQIFNQCRFGPLNTEFSTINYLKDWQATKSNILQEIASTFSGADSYDVSYFYYSGHGGVLDNISYLLPTDYDGYTSTCISVSELESALSAIPGTKVIFLDTCHSGGFIGKGKGEIIISQEELTSFNDEIINVFSQAQPKGLLTTNQYNVLTSCHHYQSSWGIYPIVPGTFDPFGVFTMALCEGCGYFGSYPADTNLDTKVGLQEAYLYVRDWVVDLDTQLPHLSIIQDVQVYPDNSTYPIVEY
jgi:PKD repeat protein